MPSTMMESTGSILDSAEWPSLGSSVPTTITSTSMKEESEDSDWENLQPLSPPQSCQRSRSVGIHVVVDIQTNHRLLSHSISTPNLRHIPLDDINEEEGNAEVSSFAMVSGPGSVVSFVSSRVSFRDVIVAGNSECTADDPSHSPCTSAPMTVPSCPHSEPRMTRPRTRYVVKSIKRCSKSTGDLQSLVEEEEEDVNSDAMGNSDAMDFYYRKSLGAKARAAGLKIRPDELKRKQFSLQKKAMQKRGQR